MQKKKRRFIILCATALLCIAAFAFFQHQSRHQFTVEKWNEYEWNEKQFLIKDFLKQYNLYEMTKPEIIELLGPEPDFYQDYSIRYKTEDNLVYDFGQEIKGVFGKSAGNISLIITFGAQDNVSKYELLTYSW